MSTPPLSKHQRYVYEEVPRSSIELAYYNPRKISEGNRKRLSKALTDHGLVEPLVFNRRTGRLVSGHQRIQDLDSKHRGSDYSIGVAVIDVDELDEIKLNVMLNNGSMQGVFDLDAVAGIGAQFNIKLPDFGFSREDLLIDFGFDLKPSAPEIQAPSSTPTAPSMAGTASPGGVLGPNDDAPEEGAESVPMSPEKALMAAKFTARREAGYEATAGGVMNQTFDDSRVQIVFDNGDEKIALMEKLGVAPDAMTIPSATYIELVRARILDGTL